MSQQSNQNRQLSSIQQKELMDILRARFASNMPRHAGIHWEDVQQRLTANPWKLWSLYKMEMTAGEPDVIGYDSETDEYLFVDCSAESPSGRRSLCYDPEALESRKKNKPAHSALGMAAEMGIEILDEEMYRTLQRLGEFDTKTSSWIKTPSDIRQLGGALFCDRRYGHVFVYHNSAESYYASRGFRGMLKV